MKIELRQSGVVIATRTITPTGTATTESFVLTSGEYALLSGGSNLEIAFGGGLRFVLSPG